MAIATNDVVAFHYKVATAEGEHVDASKPGDPLTILVGHGNIIPGLEAQILGKKVGDAFSATVAPAEAYGELDPELDLEVPKTNFPEHVRGKLKAGMQFRGPHPHDNDQDMVYTIVSAGAEHIQVTGNHQLAGKTLIFQVDIASVRPATQEELDHGHVHGAGGHHH